MKKVLLVLAIAIFMLPCLAFAGANDPLTPETLKGGKVISVDAAKGLVGSVKMFDMRNIINYGKGHIKGAVQLSGKFKSANTPDANISGDEIDMSKLPAAKAEKIMFYSDGPKGWKSYKAALIAIKAGYTNVMWMRGGSSEWETKGYPLEK